MSADLIKLAEEARHAAAELRTATHRFRDAVLLAGANGVRDVYKSEVVVALGKLAYDVFETADSSGKVLAAVMMGGERAFGSQWVRSAKALINIEIDACCECPNCTAKRSSAVAQAQTIAAAAAAKPRPT